MKKILLPGLLVALVIALGAFTLRDDNAAKGTESLEIGNPAPMTDYQMKDVSGKMFNMKDLKKDNGLLVVFSCNTCPFVVGSEGKSEGWEGRYNDLHTQAEKMGFGMVLVNSNEAKRKGDDSMNEMKSHAKNNGYTMPYVVDENHQLADAFGAKTTPHVYLFDGNMNLAYKGAIDDNVNNAKEVKETYLADAMMAVQKGEQPKPDSTKPLGCSIKRQ
ncbi:MAG: thioredoxin family protein [Flavobacteriales bacterium]|nr:thioredoxin family protein [Flavobacteriales bacterium]